MEDTLECDLSLRPDGLWRLEITNAVPPGGLSATETFALEVRRGLLTPISLRTSDSFVVTITDLMEHEINYSRTALSVTMKEGKEIERKNLRVSNDQVGEPSFHEIVFYPPAFIYPGYFISLYIPEQFQVPMPSEFSCEVASPLKEQSQRPRK